MNEYYRITLVHTYRGTNRAFIFWGENSCGYQQDIKKAGLYADKEDKDWIVVEKSVVDKFKRTTENGEEYLPNIGDYRKLLGITVLELSQLDYESENQPTNRDYFHCGYKYDLETTKEKFKTTISKTHYEVIAKESVSEWWHMVGTFEAESRNKAIMKAYNEWIPSDYDNYIDFKKDMTCKKARYIVFNGWSINRNETIKKNTKRNGESKCLS